MHSDAVGVVLKAHDGCYLVISRFAESGESSPPPTYTQHPAPSRMAEESDDDVKRSRLTACSSSGTQSSYPGPCLLYHYLQLRYDHSESWIPGKELDSSHLGAGGAVCTYW